LDWFSRYILDQGDRSKEKWKGLIFHEYPRPWRIEVRIRVVVDFPSLDPGGLLLKREEYCYRLYSRLCYFTPDSMIFYSRLHDILLQTLIFYSRLHDILLQTLIFYSRL